MRGLLLTPYFASGAALGTTKETSDRYRPLLRTHYEKFARGRCISADPRNTEELKGIRAEKPLRERGVIILFAEAGWGLFDRMADSTAGLAGPATMQLQLDRDCLSRAEAEDPRQLAADIIGMLGALRGVRPSAGQPNQPKPSQVPRRTFLQENEAKGGHILERHVGKTDEELLERLKREPHLSAASTFTDEETAEKVIKAAIAENQDLITKWLRSSTGDRIFRVT